MYNPIPNARPLPIPSSVAAMLNWAEKKGIRWPKIIYPVLFPPGYIGTMATETIYPNERIITAPNSSLMTSRLAFESQLNEVFLNHPNEFSRSLQLMTYLLYEKSKGPSSEWHDFIGYLPEHPSNLED